MQNRLTATLILTTWFAVVAAAPGANAPGAGVAVYFSPGGGCTAAIVHQVDAARTSIDVAAYQLTSQPITAALSRAAARRLAVRIILTPQAEAAAPLPVIPIAQRGGILRTDRREKLHHNKYAIIDGRITITGSFNWTANAELRNAENLVIITDAATASAYAANFAGHWNHSAAFVPRPKPDNRQNTPPARVTSLFFPRPAEEPPLWHAYLVR